MKELLSTASWGANCWGLRQGCAKLCSEDELCGLLSLLLFLVCLVVLIVQPTEMCEGWRQWANHHPQPLHRRDGKLNSPSPPQCTHWGFTGRGSCQTGRSKRKVFKELFAYQWKSFTPINGDQKPWLASRLSMPLLPEYPKCVLSCLWLSLISIL